MKFVMLTQDSPHCGTAHMDPSTQCIGQGRLCLGVHGLLHVFLAAAAAAPAAAAAAAIAPLPQLRLPPRAARGHWAPGDWAPQDCAPAGRNGNGNSIFLKKIGTFTETL